MSIKLNVAHLLGLAGILTATTIAGITTVKAAEMEVSETSPVTPMPMPTIAPTPMPTIAPRNNSVDPAAKKVLTNTLVDVASTNGSFKTLTAALKVAGLVDTLKGDGPFTVFAPTDAAFAKLPKGTVETLLKPENKAQLIKILTYHVVPGEVLSTTLKSGKVKTVEGDSVNVSVQKSGVTINKSKVTAVDVKASNGVIHVIDTVLMPPVKSATNTIVDVASANGSFKTLTAALKAAGLVDTLKGDGPFTVFAPTDAAFAKLPKGTVETLLKPENKARLVKILTYHVVPGEVLSTTLKSGKVKTVEGDSVNVSVQKSGVTINKSKVTAVDVKASNGVIHVIDTVLMPPVESPSAAKPMPRTTHSGMDIKKPIKAAY